MMSFPEFDITIFAALLSLGFFGGFTHCAGMCGPFVVSQVSMRLQNIELEKFSKFEKLKGLAILPYHFGRITTYSIIGFFCSLLGSNLKNIAEFRIISAILLMIAALVFLQILTGIKLPKFVNFARFFPTESKFITNLFRNPRGIRGYLLGIILGFLPCGMLYGAFALAITMANPIYAAFGMLCFGIATVPALFLTGSSGFLLIKHSRFKFVVKVVLAINSLSLFALAIKLIF